MSSSTGPIALVIGNKYNWKNQSERLVYLGRRMYPDGFWHQFAKVEEPTKVWCEVRRADIDSHFEETKE